MKKLLRLRQSLIVGLNERGQEVDILIRKCPLFDQHQILIGLIGFVLNAQNQGNLSLAQESKSTLTLQNRS